MHRLTNDEADRLARSIREAELHVRTAALHHAELFAAFRCTGNGTMAVYHSTAHQDALAVAEDLGDIAHRLTARIPLYEKKTRAPEPRRRLPRASRKAIESVQAGHVV